MSYKVLEQNGVNNENVDGAAFNFFCTNRKDGIIRGVLNDCTVLNPSGNIVGVDTGLLVFQGFRVKIAEPLYFTLLSSDQAGSYSLVFRLELRSDRSVSSSFSMVKSFSPMKDNLLINEEGVYESEILKASWDGTSLSSIEKTIGYLESDPSVSIELVQDLLGKAEDKAPSQKAVSDALDNKVEKIENTNKLYTGGGGAIYYSKTPVGGTIAQYDAGGCLKTSAASDDYDAINKATFEFGLEENRQYVGETSFKKPKTLGSWQILGTGDYNAETGEYTPHMYTRDPIGTGGYVATFEKVSRTITWTRSHVQNPQYTLAGADPIYPIQYANKRYVDNRVDKLDEIIGLIYDIKKISYESTPMVIPDEAMPVVRIDKQSDYLDPCKAVNWLINGVDLSEVEMRGATLTYDADNEEFTFNNTTTASKSCDIPITPVSISAGERVFITLEYVAKEGEDPELIKDLEAYLYSSSTGDEFEAILPKESSIGAYVTVCYKPETDLVIDMLGFKGLPKLSSNFKFSISFGKNVASFAVSPWFAMEKETGSVLGITAFSDVMYNGNHIGGIGSVYDEEDNAIYNYIDYEKSEAVIRLTHGSRITEGKYKGKSLVTILNEEVRIPFENVAENGVPYSEINSGDRASRALVFSSDISIGGVSDGQHPMHLELSYVVKKGGV